jgi:hypothetical protein
VVPSLPSTRRSAAALACALALLALAAPAGAMPPPEGVCGACGPGFADAAEAEGVPVSVSHSEAVVDVHDDGSATWTVRNRVGEGDAEALAEGDALDRVAARAVESDGAPTARVVGDEVVLRYRVDGFATPVAGALRVDHFRQDFAVANYDWLGADRLVLVAPEGYRVAGALPGATVADDGSRMTVTGYEAPGTFVTLAPRGPLAGARGAAAVALTLAPVVAANARRTLLFPTALFGVALAVAVVAVPRLFGLVGRAGDAPTASGSTDGGANPDVRRVAGRVAALVGALGAAALLAGTALFRPLGSVSLLAAPAAFVAAGYVLGRGDVPRAYALGLWGFAVSALAFFLPSFARRPMGAVAGGLFGLAFAVLASVAAVVCLALGWRLARRAGADPPGSV